MASLTGPESSILTARQLIITVHRTGGIGKEVWRNVLRVLAYHRGGRTVGGSDRMCPSETPYMRPFLIPLMCFCCVYVVMI